MFNLNIAVNIRGIYKILLYLYCFILLLRDIFSTLDKPVFIYLALLFTIPALLLLLEFLKKQKVTIEISLLLFITLFYILISSYNVNGIKSFIPMIYAGVAFRKIDFKYISKVFFIIQLLSLCIRCFMINNGIIYEEEMDVSWKAEDGHLAHDLGYGSSNMAGMSLFFLLCAFHLMMYSKCKWLSFLIALFGSLCIYDYTMSRTAFISSILLLITYLIPDKYNFYSRLNRLLWLAPVLVVSPLIFIDILLNIPGLDQLLSNRLYYIYYLFQLFGDPVTFITGIEIEDGRGFAIDNVFSFLLVNGGILSIVIFFWIYKSFISEISYKPPYLSAVILVIIMSGIGESSWGQFGKIGSSFFWIIFLNKSYLTMPSKYLFNKNHIYLH